MGKKEEVQEKLDEMQELVDLFQSKKREGRKVLM